MTLSSRMGVMSQGRIVQIGTPAEIYETPATRLVADFIGNVNLFEGRVAAAVRGPDELRIECAELGEVCVCRAESGPGSEVVAGATVWLALRPEKIELAPASLSQSPDSSAGAGEAPVNRAQGIVREVGYRGDASVYLVELSSGRVVRVSRPNTGREGEPRILRDAAVSLAWQRSSPVVLTR